MGNFSIDDLVRRIDILENEVRRLKGIDEPEVIGVVTDTTFFGDKDAVVSEGIAKISEGYKQLLESGCFAVMTSIGMFKWQGQTQGWLSSQKHENVENIPDDGVEEVLEPFTNPRRIKLMKALFNNNLTGSELSQKTGLVGGQLYHHLGVLEQSKLIAKDGDAYKLTLKGAKVLLLVAAVASDMWVYTATESE